MKKFLFFSIILLFTMPTQAQSTKAIQEVKKLLHTQSQDWNTGNIEAFMEGYWKSEKLQFIGSSGVTYGWESTKANYKKGYPNKSAMGHLSFKLLGVDVQSKKVVSVTGQYILKRENGEVLTGYFLLIIKKIKKKWLIIADHTSAS